MNWRPRKPPGDAADNYEAAAAADRDDARAQYDLAVFLSGEALTYINMLNPDLNVQGPEHAAYRQQAIGLLRRCLGIRAHLMTLNPTSLGWTSNEAYEQVLLGTLEQETAEAAAGLRLATTGITTLRELAASPDATPDILDNATSALLFVQPLRLRDPAWTLTAAQRLVSLTHRRRPDCLLTLAQAYHQAGRTDLAAATANEGLALLPATAARRSRLWKLLSTEAQRGAG